MPSTPHPPAFETADVSSGPAMPPPIPTEKIGYSIPSCQQSAVFSIMPPERETCLGFIIRWGLRLEAKDAFSIPVYHLLTSAAEPLRLPCTEGVRHGSRVF